MQSTAIMASDLAEDKVEMAAAKSSSSKSTSKVEKFEKKRAKAALHNTEAQEILTKNTTELFNKFLDERKEHLQARVTKISARKPNEDHSAEDIAKKLTKVSADLQSATEARNGNDDAKRAYIQLRVTKTSDRVEKMKSKIAKS
jgi:hypothetical protein